MPPRAQFTRAERNFLTFEYHKSKGTKNFKLKILREFQLKFPTTRVPGKNQMKCIWEKQILKGTVNNCNSQPSPGPTHSGRTRTARTPPNVAAVKGVLDRDSTKEIGDDTVSPVSSARRNFLAITKSSWNRITKGLRLVLLIFFPSVYQLIILYSYHPYKPVRRHELKPEDLPRRLAFAQWIITLTDQQLGEFLFSDEANFLLSGHVNSQNVRRYAPLKTSDPAGGRPDHFMVEKPTFTQKLMVFCGIKRDGTFSLRIYRNETLTGPSYHALLQHRVFPELRNWNGGNLDRSVCVSIP